MKIIRFEEIDSTNDYVKSLLRSGKTDGEDLVVTAKKQTGGRGTKGRSFVSEEGGVYLTRLYFYRDFPASDAFLVMAGASVAVCRTLEKFGLTATIKWPNDVYVNDKKICGILIENTFSGATISSSVVGIGLNVNNSLPEELKDAAISMREAAGKAFDRAAVENALIEETGNPCPIDEYRKRVGYLDRRVSLFFGDECVPAYALFVNERGELVAEIDGARRAVTAAEVSLRLR